MQTADIVPFQRLRPRLRLCCAFQTACRIAGRLKNRMGSVANLLESLFAVCFDRWPPSIGKKGQ